MAKKMATEAETKEVPINKFMSETQFLKMKVYQGEMQVAEAKYQQDFAQQTIRDLQIEIAKLKQELRKADMMLLSKKASDCKKAYEEFKKELESELDVSLEGTVIDSVTYEIKKV